MNSIPDNDSLVPLQPPNSKLLTLSHAPSSVRRDRIFNRLMPLDHSKAYPLPHAHRSPIVLALQTPSVESLTLCDGLQLLPYTAVT